MTNDTRTELPLHLRLPQYRMDYEDGHFTSTQSGERVEALSGVILAMREDRVLWPSERDPNRTPHCVNGSKYGPCACRYAQWDAQGNPPACSQEMTILLRESTGNVATVTARRSMIRALDQYVGMQELLGEPVHAQQVELRLVPDLVRGEGGLHVLRLAPGVYLETAEREKMAELAARITATFTAGALE